MPHITLEFSQGADQVVDVPAIVDAVHRTALESGVFPVGGVRTFARISPCSRVFDGAPENGFLQISVRIAPGRSLEVRQKLARDLLAAAEAQAGGLFARGPAGIQLEITEFDPQMSVRRNTALPDG
ncbi:5-carboxymethyl-2-hydroxymuconate Delta-isomerase [Bosea sp. (in: a-proteobacteria)]|uniref:5-carboxymethyl-2-hydroxymuconate Delta-isomerase n=1 Tax=Bosea sp. (in: a-proteobacteria) TaxID=1871050 RepID=UPI002FC9D5BA